MLVIPGALAGLIGLHLWLVVRIGVSSPPWSPTAAGRPQPGPPPRAEEGARRAGSERGEEAMNRRLEERRADHARYKQDVKTRGKPFFPYAMFHDTVMSLLVVCVIVALAVIWKYSTPHEDPSSSGWLGKLYDEKADPGTTNFVPRPDWYFYFLFYLLRIFKWPESVLLGTVIIPTILIVLLIALPFIDIGRERRPLRRPVAMTAAILVIISMGALTYKGATAKEPLAAENLVLVPQWAAEAGVRRTTRSQWTGRRSSRRSAA